MDIRMMIKVNKNVIYSYLLLTLSNRASNVAIGTTARALLYLFNRSTFGGGIKHVIHALYILITYHFKIFLGPQNIPYITIR